MSCLKFTPDPRDELARLEQEASTLASAWEYVPEGEIPAGLTERTMARLRAEGLLTPQPLRVEWGNRWATAVGVAAALLLVAGLQRWSGDPAASLSKREIPETTDWAAGLVLPERFESPGQELETRLERVNRLLHVDETEGAPDATDELRSRVDRLSRELEVF